MYTLVSVDSYQIGGKMFDDEMTAHIGQYKNNAYAYIQTKNQRN